MRYIQSFPTMEQGRLVSALANRGIDVGRKLVKTGMEVYWAFKALYSQRH